MIVYYSIDQKQTQSQLNGLVRNVETINIGCVITLSSTEESWISGLPFVCALIAVGVIVAVGISIFSFTEEFKTNMKKIQTELQAEQDRWETLTCDEKRSYLSGKNLSGNRIFYTSNNEAFYREYVLDCLPPDIAREVVRESAIQSP